MAFKYRDSFVTRLFDDIGGMLGGDAAMAAGIEPRLNELVCANSPAVIDYWKRTRRGLGVPDAAFKGTPPYLFPEEAPVHTFRTSGTTGGERGAAHYSAQGLELMNLSILANARRHIIRELTAPVILRMVPSAAAAPEMVIAYGMEHIAKTFGHAELSTCLLGPQGVDFALMQRRLDTAVAENLPVVLIGASFAFVNICDASESQGRRWQLPPGSRTVDAGGFKGRSRVVDVDSLRSAINRVFGIPAQQCINLFGMTELASQLYDGADIPLGPLGERPKSILPWVRPQVRDAHSLELRATGSGLLEVVDLCIIDRPYAVLTGDRGIACEAGVASAGRIERGQSRGCSLTLDAITQGTATHD
jgi:hypothetical protein